MWPNGKLYWENYYRFVARKTQDMFKEKQAV